MNFSSHSSLAKKSCILAFSDDDRSMVYIL
jgi:hypothetical protein